MKSDILNREIIDGLRDKNTYVHFQDQGVAEHKHQFYQKDKGQIIITIRPIDGEGFDTILSALNTLGDGCVDTFIALQAIAIDRNGTQHIRTPFQIGPDDILELCGKQKSHGSFTPFQRIEIIKQIKTLSRAHIIATMPGPGRRRGQRTEATFYKAEGSIIDLLSFKIGEYNTITGEELWEKRTIALGGWVTMIPELSNQTATMLRQVLAYSAKNEKYQKRLGIYLSLMFRINAKTGGKFPNDISTQALLEGAGIVPDKKNPGRFRDAILKALDRLKADGVIGDYWLVVDSSEKGKQRAKEIQEQAYGWGDLFLEEKWNFLPPKWLQKQYQGLLKEASGKA